MKRTAFLLLLAALCLLTACVSPADRTSGDRDSAGEPARATETPPESGPTEESPNSSGSGEPVQDAYGPTMLACLEYTAHRFGIRPYLGQAWFSLGKGKPYEYCASFYGRRYAICSGGRKAEIFADGKLLGEWDCGIRVITDEAGNVLDTVRMEEAEDYACAC